MSAVEKDVKVNIFGTTTIKGKITEVSEYDGKKNYLMVMPSDDEYSLPAVVRVQSERTHKQGDVVTMKVKIGGYPNNFNDRNGNPVRSAHNTLTEII